MALLEDCFFCSLSVAASVIGVYTLVAYLIAFFMEVWWIISTPVYLPSPAYVLCVGYLIITVFSGVLLRGLSIKNSLFLLQWLVVVSALSVPEGVLVYFMSIHYWNIRSLYGLMELTCWVCRAIINVSGMICVQSLYSNWREEKDVVRRLRDLNMTRVIPNRRNSVTSQANGYHKGLLVPPKVHSGPPQMLNNGTFVSPLRGSESTLSVHSRSQTPVVFSVPVGPVPFYPHLAATNEFNASQFDQCLKERGEALGKSYSMTDLRPTGSVLNTDKPRKAHSVVDFPLEKSSRPPPPLHQTQSLDRRIFKHAYGKLPPHVDGLYVPNRLENAYFPSFPVNSPVQHSDFVYGRNINSFYPGKINSRSKHSLGSESDDFQKYRDIAL